MRDTTDIMCNSLRCGDRLRRIIVCKMLADDNVRDVTDHLSLNMRTRQPMYVGGSVAIWHNGNCSEG